ncbi:hypothetical protein FSP39_022273 [Pinctada imbricata]|uniref:DZIP3-like HEPN domain-containing protein n=1 Tax=Pinctada imbricata TaxID=66713 RepID=A0AA89CBH8_PINIB|nr:hypothetical protein FSP39_022273 [Pinctada imbricata]
MSVSQLNEARYGRACFLVLNTCPVTLRRVIDHYCSTTGFNDLEGLLNHVRNKHDLFHLSFGQCCCGHTSRNKPLRKQQWELLYRKTYSSNPHGQQGQCYCMYSAIPGVTSDVMDVTLCCLVIRNICRGINNADIDAISSVRNQLIHASSATLEDTAYNYLWKKVETAVISLAKKADSVIEMDTKRAVQEMKDRIMNPVDLCSLKDLISDQKCMDELRQVLATMFLNYLC